MHVTVEVVKIKGKEKDLQQQEEKVLIAFRGAVLGHAAGFSTEMMESKYNRERYLQIAGKNKNFRFRILYLMTTAFHVKAKNIFRLTYRENLSSVYPHWSKF